MNAMATYVVIGSRNHFWFAIMAMLVVLPYSGEAFAESDARTPNAPPASVIVQDEVRRLIADPRLQLGLKDASNRDFFAAVTLRRIADSQVRRICTILLASKGNEKGFLVLHADGTVYAMVKTGLAAMTEPSDARSLLLAADVGPSVVFKGSGDEAVLLLMPCAKDKQQMILDIPSVLDAAPGRITWVRDPLLKRLHGETSKGTLDVYMTGLAGHNDLPVDRLQMSTDGAVIVEIDNIQAGDIEKCPIKWLSITREQLLALPVTVKTVGLESLLTRRILPRRGDQENQTKDRSAASCLADLMSAYQKGSDAKLP
ncbi:MAG: hypothetical protein ABSH20_18990 [Tepidisphaeraceae bacterium]|jgi:hypothetical protein